MASRSVIGRTVIVPSSLPKATLLVGALALAALAPLSGCSTTPEAHAETNAASLGLSDPEAFPVGTPQRTNVADRREYAGKVTATRHAELRARFRGVVQSVNVDEGQHVRAGQALFTLGAADLQQQLVTAQAEVKTAEAELAVAQLEEKSARLLLDKGVVSDAEVAMARSKVNALEAKIQEAKAHAGQVSVQLGFTRIQAPFEGVVNRLRYRAGSLVQEDDLLTTVTNTSEVYVYFQMSERDYLAHRDRLTGAHAERVTMRLVDGSAYPLSGVVDAIASEFDPDTGNLAIRAKFENPDQLLKHGASATVVLSHPMQDVLVIPQSSTFDVQGNVYVYVVDDDNVARARKVVPRLRVDDTFVLESGLSVDERFVLEGVQRIREGAVIRPSNRN